MKRSIVITKPARLAIDRTRLSISQEAATNFVPIEDLDILVLDHDAIDITAPTLGTLTSQGVVVVVSDSRHLPCGYLLPLENHNLMAQTLRGQIAASVPVMKRIWQAIIVAKVLAQDRVIQDVHQQDCGLKSLARQVASGDRTNCEGRAAAIYFDALFGPDFGRLRGDEIEEEENPTYRLANAGMNYGYAILRATVARAVVAAGLNPTLGIFHRHRNNPLALADDLMEPLRPAVDRLVVELLRGEHRDAEDLTPPIKRHLLSILTAEIWWDDRLCPLDIALTSYVKDVRQCLLGEAKRIRVPSG